MTLYSLNICDRAGRVLRSNRVAASDVHGALGHANRRLRRLIDRPAETMDLLGHIDVTDRDGRTVARVMMAETLASMR
jgi:hypothetical protein